MNEVRRKAAQVVEVWLKHHRDGVRDDPSLTDLIEAALVDVAVSKADATVRAEIQRLTDEAWSWKMTAKTYATPVNLILEESAKFGEALAKIRNKTIIWVRGDEEKTKLLREVHVIAAEALRSEEEESSDQTGKH